MSTPTDQEVNLISLLAPAVISAIVVGIVSLIQNRHLKKLEARLTALTGFNTRKLEAHEELWVLVQNCKRRQLDVRAKKKSRTQLGTSLTDLAESRATMKNLTFDKGLYFETETRQLVMDLDKILADPKVDNAGEAVAAIEDHVRGEVDALLKGAS